MFPEPRNPAQQTVTVLKINDPQSAISTDYCVLIESGIGLTFFADIIKNTINSTI